MARKDVTERESDKREGGRGDSAICVCVLGERRVILSEAGEPGKMREMYVEGY